MGIALFVIGLIGLCGLLGLGIYRVIKLKKHPMPKTINWKSEMKWVGVFGILHAILFVVCFVGVMLWKNYPLSGLEWFLLIFGGIVTSLSFYTFIGSFILYYYVLTMPERLKIWMHRFVFIFAASTIVFFFVFTEGFANHISYPLVNFLSFTHGFISNFGRSDKGIAFYAICILGGAIFVYCLCDHKFYQQYGKHGIIDSTFLVAFPAGVIGARIAYVIGNWSKDFAGQPFWKVFAIWEGGLTILGGAIGGIVVGVLWFLWRNKAYSIWLAVDIIVPSILIAQAIGRWGNFFNCEVYGEYVNDSYFRWLPSIIFNQLHYSSGGQRILAMNTMVVPLFLIESIINLTGYFVLSFVFGKVFRKQTELGDLAIGYLIWYGLTRTFLEPLRNPEFNMGSNGYWSWFWSLIFVIVGAILIVGNHILKHKLRLKIDDYRMPSYTIKRSTLGMSVFFSLGLAILIPGIVLMSINPFTNKISLTGFNLGVIFLVIGISVGIIGVIYLVKLLDFKKENVNV